MGWRILAGLLPVFSLLAAGDTQLDRATLRGLKTLSVVVDRIDPELENAPDIREALQARLARRLETESIGVDPGAPEFLGLRLLSVRARRGPHAVSIALGLYQPVTLVRDRTMKTATQTWEVHTVLLSDPKRLSDDIVRATDELLDGFMAAYRSVNPAGASTGNGPAR